MYESLPAIECQGKGPQTVDGERQKFRELFASEARRPERRLRLDRAALYLAGENYPDLDVEFYLKGLDEMADQVRAWARDPQDQESLIDALNQRLFDQLGFTGTTTNSYDPDHCFLNRALDTRTSIPITLSLIYLEVARRVGIRCEGIGLPGHLLVRLDALDLYLDPFSGGNLLSSSDCVRLVRDMFGVHFPWREEFLSPYSKKDILFRMLSNLKSIYLHLGNYSQATDALQRMAMINPESHYINRDLTWCYVNLHEQRTARRHLEMYMQAAWPSDETSEMGSQVESVWSVLTQLS